MNNACSVYMKHQVESASVGSLVARRVSKADFVWSCLANSHFEESLIEPNGMCLYTKVTAVVVVCFCEETFARSHFESDSLSLNHLTEYYLS